MIEPQVDADAFNAFEAAGWERQVAGYKDFFIPITTRLIGPLLDAAGVAGGSRMLDVALRSRYSCKLPPSSRTPSWSRTWAKSRAWAASAMNALDHRAVAVARQLHQNRVAGRVILGVERAQIAARGRHRAVELSGLLHPRAAAWLRLVVW